MKTAEVRSAFLSFFAERGHHIVPSSTLVPLEDPTLLFTNAGMNQFKDALLGKEDLGFLRAASSQRCVRAGGKHNDLENVGYTARHHTFFEMLGNFSFGDYFKEETIAWAWEFITEVLKLPIDRLWVTVHPTDDESRSIWEEIIGVRADRVISLEENFWSMGETGPCGPCTEIFYDHGPQIDGGPPGSADADGDRYVEFWNLVFPQFDRTADGELNPLPQPGVDTGLGLERITAIMQGVHSNYEIDLFRNLLLEAGSFAGMNDEQIILNNPSLRVIVDHIRSASFLIADGVMPGNENRNYVLRRIIRRGLRHGYKLKIRDAFFHRLVKPLVDEMGDAYPLLAEKEAQITAALLREEERFAETLNQGMVLLNRTIDDLTGKEIPGEVIFQLYDTFGFPVDLTADVARENGLTMDVVGFEAAMEAQRERGRTGAKFSATLGQRIHTGTRVEFSGYTELCGECAVTGLFSDTGEAVAKLQAGDSGVVVLDRTPFYAESGGQVGDTGDMSTTGVRFRVDDTQVGGEQHLHQGEVEEGELLVGITLTAAVDAARRNKIVQNHTATHLLHAALRATLGEHVEQKGSMVGPERLRFDFSHPEPVAKTLLTEVERLVNEQIQKNTLVEVEQLEFDAALEKGAMALFGEKYGDQVRVLTMGGGFSVELCGGTHAARTGDIGVFKIVAETGIAAGVRRIDALSGPGALDWINETQSLLDGVSGLVKSSRGNTEDKVAGLVEENRRIGKELAQLKQKLASSHGSDLAGKATVIDGVHLLATEVEGDSKTMLSTLDALKSRLDSAVIVLGQVNKGKVSLIVAVTNNLTDRITATEVLDVINPQVGARGGGSPEMARAGGGDSPQKLSAALTSVQLWLSERFAVDDQA
ncbi:MAG: alanine--tRNA ligase [Gammaproteobacteria bacterium]|nr:alanine--tRNA ligase [Gammaproteobacteria bacterium]